MGLKKEKFTEEKIEKLKKYIERYHSIGQAIEYEIVIDNFKTVRRTDDPSLFDDYKLFLVKDTREILIRLFTGKSNNCDKVIYYWEE
ncbi:MAG: hypothetical protein K2X86_09950 [Cytophagaceae bacterium]|nr:hypothetical protein [Cytophagaceae bacterium]